LGGAIAFGLTMGITRVGSLSSLSGLLIASVVELVESVLSAGTLGAHLWAGFFMIFVIVLRHEANLDALLNDQERKF
jgi:glycerol-3-phosphate acyltransferase PlsY